MIKKTVLSCLLVLAGAAQAGALTVYTCKDARGKTAFSEKPCSANDTLVSQKQVRVDERPVAPARSPDKKEASKAIPEPPSTNAPVKVPVS